MLRIEPGVQFRTRFCRRYRGSNEISFGAPNEKHASYESHFSFHIPCFTGIWMC